MKKAMVLQDIKNTNSSDPDPPAPGRRKKDKSRKAVTTDQVQDLNVSESNSPAHKLNLPLLQRIQMALEKSKEGSASTKVEKREEQVSTTQVPNSLSQVQTPSDEPVNVNNKETSSNEGKDDTLSSQSLNVCVKLDNMTVSTTSILEETTANSSLDQAFCNISELEQSAVDSQSTLCTDTNLQYGLEAQSDLDTIPKSEEGPVYTHNTQESCDKLGNIPSCSLVSPDMQHITEESKTDTERVDVKTGTPQKTPYVCVLSQLEENQSIPPTSSEEDDISDPSSPMIDLSSKTVSSNTKGKCVPNPDVSTPKDILDDIDLEVENFVAGRESKCRKSSRRRSQQVLSVPVLTAEPSPEVVDKSSQEGEIRTAEGTTPSLCIINDKKRGARGRRKRPAAAAATSASPVEDWTTMSSADSPLLDEPAAGRGTPDTDVSDHSAKSNSSPPTTPATHAESLSISPEGSHAQEGVAGPDLTTPSVCLIDDRNSRRRRKKSPVTATSPLDDGESGKLADVSQQQEVQNEMAPAVCVSSGRGSRGRRRKAPTDTSPSTDNLASASPEESRQCQQNIDDAPSVCLINDAPRGSHKKRRKRMGEETTSSEVPVQSSASDERTPVLARTSKIPNPTEPTTEELPELVMKAPAAIPETTPLRGDPQPNFTVVKEVKEKVDRSDDLKRKVSKKRRRQDLEPPIITETSSILPAEKIHESHLSAVDENKPTGVNQGEVRASKEQQDELMLDDVDFGESFPAIEKPKKQQKRRRRSADFDISTAPVIESPNLEEDLEGINWLENQAPSRRSKRLRRKSLDLYRESISKAREDEEEKRRKSNQQEISQAEENLEVSENELSEEVIPKNEQLTPENNVEKVDPMDIGPATAVPVLSPQSNPDSQTDDSVTEDEPRRSRRAPKVNLTTQLEEAVASSVTAPKTKRGKKSKKNEPSVEDIYLNKLWRTQMPKDKIWETIYEVPKSTKWGTQENMSKMRLKRHVNFDDFYTTNRLKRRRQKALKIGWKPLSEHKEMVAAAKLEERMQSLDREISKIETKTLCTPEVCENVVPTVCVRLASPTGEQTNTECEDDFYTPVQSASNLLQFGQLEDTDTDQSASLNSADVSASPLQTFATPMLESVGERLKSFASYESSTTKTQSDSQS